MSDALGVPVVLDTDVNASALGEHLWGAARGVDDFVYVTVGTGIGGRRDGERESSCTGSCTPRWATCASRTTGPPTTSTGSVPYHGDCLEGLASGPAIERRWGIRQPDLLPDDHPAWELEAGYLAAGVANLVCTLSPRLVVMGGGVMERPSLLPRIRARVLGAAWGLRPRSPRCRTRSTTT